MKCLIAALFFLTSVISVTFCLSATNKESPFLAGTTLLLLSSPICTDADSDGFYAEENCGTLVDCDDDDPALNPADIDEDGYSSCAGDCNDADAALNPADNDTDGYSSCDGDCDDDDPSLNLADIDADGYDSCEGDCDDNNAALNLDDNDTDGYSSCDGDCDDDDPLVYPGTGC